MTVSSAHVTHLDLSADDRARRHRWALAAALPAVVIAVALPACAWAWGERLPAQIANDVNARGEVVGTTSLGALLGVLLPIACVFPLLVAGYLWHTATLRPTLGLRAVLGAAIALPLIVGGAGLVILAVNLDAATPDQVRLPWRAYFLAAPALGLAAAVALWLPGWGGAASRPTPERVAAPTSARPEPCADHGAPTASLGAAGAASYGAGTAVWMRGTGAGVAGPLVSFVVLVGWPRGGLALADIARVEVVQAEPLTGGGWGLHLSGRTTTLLVRRGAAIRAEARSGRALVIVIDDASGAVALPQRMIAERDRTPA